MKKLFTICIFLFILGSCSIFNSNTSQVQDINTSTQVETLKEVVKIEGVFSYLEGVPEQFQKDESFQACMINTADGCIQAQLETSQEEYNCDIFLVDSNKTYCQDMRLLDQAVQEGNIDKCSELSANIDECKYEIILSQSDASLCSNLDDVMLVSCNNTLIRNNAAMKKDSSICEGIMLFDPSDTSEIDDCKDQINR